jgi:hypothetical protein
VNLCSVAVRVANGEMVRACFGWLDGNQFHIYFRRKSLKKIFIEENSMIEIYELSPMIV